MAYDAQCRLGSRLNAFRLNYYTQPVAWLDARSGIARSGASRSDYYEKLNVAIDIGGVDVSGYIRHGTLRISEALNDEPDTASFTLVPTVPTIPRIGDVVRIGLGTVDNLEFGGRIASIQHTREAARNPPFLQILCVDFLPDFDQRLVNYSWPAQSASTTILDLVARFCQHNANAQFTTLGVKPNLPTLAAFEVTNARPSDIMRRMMTLCGGGFYVGPTRDLHAWADGPEPGYPDPAPLSLDLITLKAFAHVEDGTQARSSMVVEGPKTSIVIAMPASAGELANGLPVEDATMFRNQANFEARIGSQRVFARWVQAAWDPAVATTGTLSADVPASATVQWYPVSYADGGVWLYDMVVGGVAWGKVGEQYCLLHRSTNTLMYILVGPSYEALRSPAKSGTIVAKADGIFGIFGITDTATAGNSVQPVRAQPIGSDFVGVVRQFVNNAAGVYPPPNVEHLISDNRLSFAGARERAQIELDNFAHVDISCEWETDDPNARIGRHQTIALESPDALSTTVVILKSDITWPVANRAPRRHCSGGTVKRANILDIMLTSKD